MQSIRTQRPRPALCSVSEALADLTPREQRILRIRFGIGSTADHTLEEIGKEFGVTRERIRQIEAKALENSAIRHARTSLRLSSTTDPAPLPR
jgi:RNA polymerase primary sigma factor